jgi:hypothetical protein
VEVEIAIQLASLLSLLTYIYWFYTPFPTLVGALFSAAALPLLWNIARDNGGRWPRVFRRAEHIPRFSALGRCPSSRGPPGCGAG